MKEILKYETDSIEIDVDGVIYIECTTYRVFADGSKEVACSSKYPKQQEEETIIDAETILDVLLGVE